MSLLKTTLGMFVKSKKDGKVAKVTAVGEKVTIELVDTKEIKEIAKSTFERWYEEVEAPANAEATEGSEVNNQQEKDPATQGTENKGTGKANTTQAQAGKTADKGKGTVDKGTANAGKANSKPAKTAEELQAEADAKAVADKAKADAKAEADRVKAEKKAESEKAKAEKKAEAEKAKAEKKAEADKAKAEKLANKQNKALNEPKAPDPIVVGYREELEAFAKGLGDDMTIKDASTYRGVFAGTRNICEIHPQKKKIKVHINSKSLTAEMLGAVKVVPKTFGWTLDAIYNITNKDELEFAKKLIEAGKNFKK